MADAQDRRLPASERKIRKARADGQVARSRDLSHFAAIGAAAALLSVAAPRLMGWLQATLAAGLRF
ncbi:MAG TPA: EscU/YscU/HrcU family type III secretion system export apparatus switch protein, partial [Rubrivivax sp.]|nr:EscU/YscU/HrcU family type III secretion system export apparatus switch protein [Rubrivivax sp.]